MSDKNLSKFYNIIPGMKNSVKDVIPYIKGTDLEEIENIDTIVNSIQNILMVRKGTYLFDPDFGVGLHKYIFELADKTTETSINNEVRDAISQYEKRANITINIEFFSNMKGFRIKLYIEKDSIKKTLDLDYTENLLTSLD